MITVRERNPERSRQRILDAAQTEFAAKGFAGARVEAIARRAGLNKQLISHHFGGKLGLYQAVMSRRRRVGGAALASVTGPMPDALATLNALGADDPEWIRVLLWETLEDGERAEGADERRARYRDRVAWIVDEQTAGRLPADLEPELLLLSLMGAALYPLLLPTVVDLVCSEDPTGDAFTTRYRDHLVRLASHLAG
jgi:AcrR family transcriptional regulator